MIFTVYTQSDFLIQFICIFIILLVFLWDVFNFTEKILYIETLNNNRYMYDSPRRFRHTQPPSTRARFSTTRVSRRVHVGSDRIHTTELLRWAGEGDISRMIWKALHTHLLTAFIPRGY